MYEFKYRRNRRSFTWVVEEQTRDVVREERRIFFKRLAWYRRRVESLETQAVVDDLTGLRNQRALWRELTRRAGASSTESPLALVMLDFDMFNEVNQRYGHAVGDAVLRRAAAVFRDHAPSARLAFRYGGEEFVLLVPGDEEDGRAVAEDIRAEIARQNGRLPAVTVSCGVAQFDRPVEPWIALDRVDAALRTAKRTGRNRVVVSGRPETEANAYLVEEIEHETARRAALALATATLAVRDRNTADHSDDVLTLCECLGRAMGLDHRALERLMAGAQLHDVGKVAVPSEILNKPGPLNENEWAVIREHTVIGERILRSVPEMAEVATIVRHSHEHWNGEGYPDGLSGEQIPLASRIILCADAFHAIRSDRPYRRGRPAAEAITELRACSGTQFDPAVVAALAEAADDVQRQRAVGTVGGVLPRNKRLVALLAGLVIGSGSAVAGVPELRNAIRSVFGAATSEPTRAFADEPGPAFSFGPLGDLLSIAPVDVRKPRNGERRVVPRSQAARSPGPRSAAANRRRASGAFEAPRGSRRGRTRAPARAGAPKPTRKTAPTRSPATPGTTTTPGPTSTSGTPEEAAPTGSGNSNSTSDGGNGNGRALGHSLPTPRRPAQKPNSNRTPGSAPQPAGRIDPPAIGRNTLPVPKLDGINGKGSASHP